MKHLKLQNRFECVILCFKTIFSCLCGVYLPFCWTFPDILRTALTECLCYLETAFYCGEIARFSLLLVEMGAWWGQGQFMLFVLRD